MTTPDEPSTGDDEVTRLQHDLDVANDCASADAPAEEEPPGAPAG